MDLSLENLFQISYVLLIQIQLQGGRVVDICGKCASVLDDPLSSRIPYSSVRN